MPGDIYHGDCLEDMKLLPDHSVDMILCDLPYGTTACKWDTILPFDKLWSEYRRVLKQNAAVVLTASQPFSTAVVMSNIVEFKYELIWEKEQGVDFLLAKKRPLKAHENVLVFCAGSTPYHPQMTIGKPYKSGKGNSGEVSGSVTKTQTENSGTRYPKSVIKINRETGMHPTQKPVALFEYLIKTYTNEGDTVLDNCAGSGTTAVACVNTKRKYIVMEKEAKYVEIIERRLRELGDIA